MGKVLKVTTKTSFSVLFLCLKWRLKFKCENKCDNILFSLHQSSISRSSQQIYYCFRTPTYFVCYYCLQRLFIYWGLNRTLVSSLPFGKQGTGGGGFISSEDGQTSPEECCKKQHRHEALLERFPKEKKGLACSYLLKSSIWQQHFLL